MPSFAHSSTAPITIVALGDSLTAGYGLPRSQSFPARLEQQLQARGHHIRVINAGVSGDTASGGLARLDWAVPANADGVIVELGANDALRGIDPHHTRKALDDILHRLKKSGKQVLLAGMEAPRNLGATYVRRFRSLYEELARKHDTVFYPFFLKGVVLEPGLNLSDGMHPNGRGVDMIVRNILPKVEALIARIKTARKS